MQRERGINIVEFVTIVGIFAAFLSTICSLPQLAKVWKTKSVKDISSGMFSIQCFATSLWLVYGVFLNNSSMMAANVVVLGQGITMLLLKIKYN